MSSLKTLVDFFDKLLQPQNYSDSAHNGLQVEASSEVKTVAFAVDAGLSVIQKAIEANAGLLVVHHGIYWGRETPCTGTFGKKLSLLLKNHCSLYASHLPLDGNLEVGNGAELARFLELEQIEGFCEYKGATIGAKGRYTKSRSLDFFREKAAQMVGCSSPLVLPFGPDKISKVGIVTGSGSEALALSVRQGLDLLVSGEPKHQIYHECKELGTNAIFLGHYASETFGVRALMPKIQKIFGLPTVFIDEPSGI